MKKRVSINVNTVTKYVLGRGKVEILIKNCRVVDDTRDFQGDIYIKDGKIAEYGKKLEHDCKTIKGDGLVAMPAFIDIHVHFREPGYTYKEDIYTGSLAH